MTPPGRSGGPGMPSGAPLRLGASWVILGRLRAGPPWPAVAGAAPVVPFRAPGRSAMIGSRRGRRASSPGGRSAAPGGAPAVSGPPLPVSVPGGRSPGPPWEVSRGPWPGRSSSPPARRKCRGLGADLPRLMRDLKFCRDIWMDLCTRREPVPWAAALGGDQLENQPEHRGGRGRRGRQRLFYFCL